MIPGVNVTDVAGEAADGVCARPQLAGEYTSDRALNEGSLLTVYLSSASRLGIVREGGERMCYGWRKLRADDKTDCHVCDSV